MPSPRATTALVPAAARVADVFTEEEQQLSDDAVETFATLVGGRTGLVESLAIGTGAPEIDKLVNLLLDPRYKRYSVRRLCGVVGLTVTDLFTAYRKAALMRAHIQATHTIAAKIPPVVEDVMTRAVPQPIVCDVCKGLGSLETKACWKCQGTGQTQSEPDLDRQKLALELGHLIEKKGGGLIVQQNQIAAGAMVAGGTGVLEQLQQAVGELLFNPTRVRAASPRPPSRPFPEEIDVPLPFPDPPARPTPTPSGPDDDRSDDPRDPDEAPPEDVEPA